MDPLPQGHRVQRAVARGDGRSGFREPAFQLVQDPGHRPVRPLRHIGGVGGGEEDALLQPTLHDAYEGRRAVGEDVPDRPPRAGGPQPVRGFGRTAQEREQGVPFGAQEQVREPGVTYRFVDAVHGRQ